ncbi:2824_t:CDS:1, partial [Funneliformis geosporum]
MSVQQQQSQKRYSEKKIKDSLFGTSNSTRMSQPSNESESENEILGTIEISRSPSISTLENEGLEECALAKFKTLGSHYPDNHDITNLVTIIKKGRRKERLNKLNGLDKEQQRKKQNQQQSLLFSQ